MTRNSSRAFLQAEKDARIFEAVNSFLSLMAPRELTAGGVSGVDQLDLIDIAGDPQNAVRAMSYMGYAVTRVNWSERDRYAVLILLQMMSECIATKVVMTGKVIEGMDPKGWDADILNKIQNKLEEVPILGWIFGDSEMQDMIEKDQPVFPDGDDDEENIAQLMRTSSKLANWLRYNYFPESLKDPTAVAPQKTITPVQSGSGGGGGVPDVMEGL